LIDSDCTLEAPQEGHVQTKRISDEIQLCQHYQGTTAFSPTLVKQERASCNSLRNRQVLISNNALLKLKDEVEGKQFE
jgi:hypothetical protein